MNLETLDRLLDAFEDAAFDCGEYIFPSPGTDPEYEARRGRLAERRTELREYVLKETPIKSEVY